MPMINIEYNDERLEEQEILSLSEAIQKIVSKSTNINDVFVYANSSKIKVKIAPIEIFIRMSAHKIENRDKLIKEIKTELQNWKKKKLFDHKINLTLIPMDWNIEIEV
ncbi:MAG: hypothetical protein AABW51_01105 [Nanoarchaeota archaeon]